MKKYSFVIALAMALTTGSALAADLPSTKAPVFVPPPPPAWTGFYAGLNAGYSFGGSQSINTAAGPVWTCGRGQGHNGDCRYGPGPLQNAEAAGANSFLSINSDGFIGGGQFGYNYQWGSSFLVGIETDIQGTGIHGEAATATTLPIGGGSCTGTPCLTTTTTGVTKSLDYLGTLRARIGWLATPTLLVYGTGGFAYGGAHLKAAITSIDNGCWWCSNPGIAAGQFNDILTGWTAGAGVEWLFTPNLSLKAEYLYYDLGSVKLNGLQLVTEAYAEQAPLFANGVQTNARFNGHIVRAGMNYHVNWWAPAPVLAKY